MFNKLKQLKDLRSQAKVMQNALAGEIITTEKGGVKIVMNGNMEVTSVEINQDIDKSSIAKLVQENINDTIKKTQKVMAQKMQEIGGFPGLN